ncbi:ABC transporter substrate-binding protein [Amycolatopsis sp. AA4]|uniref:ABC transporter substrate-binding protein n=1 Tax=Actinomycetes TaxID=1760 RepID=UPI0001B58078|nr:MULTISPECIES: ABC transporter substrate-binding protein [Actinomycetes]ATY12373.1 ABC transporter substrate-binding protein [Amycolatopsis sp. AA4]EFL08136.1 periplasmic solute binding protein [Streptomyces sp. AA4]
MASFPRLGALILGALLLSGCGSAAQQPAAPAPASGSPEGPAVVAASTWEGAFAKAAGAGKVTVLVPPSIKHAPDYDPKPSDLAAVAGARYVLYSRFEGFAGKLKDAAGSSATTVGLTLDNSKDNVEKEVRRLAGMFGTQAAAEKWIAGFEAEYARLSGEVKAKWPGGKQPQVIEQAFVGFAAQLSGANVLAAYGPEPVTAARLAELSAKHPQYVFDNEAMSTGTVLPGTPAKQVSLVNYPGQDLDLLSVYRQNAKLLADAFA